MMQSYFCLPLPLHVEFFTVFVKFMEMISTMYGLSQKQQLYQVAGSVSVPSGDRIKAIFHVIILIQCRLFNT